MVQKTKSQAETLSGSPQPGFTGYSNSPIIAKRNPTTMDTGFPLGQDWVNKANGQSYQLTRVVAGVADWVNTGSNPSGNVNTLTGDTGGAISPVGGNINIIGGDGVIVNGAGNTLTIDAEQGGYPITPYVVGPVNQAGFQTIQSALNAANGAGGGIVYVQPGTYTEDLTCYGDTEVVAVCTSSDAGTTGNTVTIVGLHTPPATGSFAFSGVKLQSATDVFLSAAAGSAELIVQNCTIALTDGFIFNLVNWVGNLIINNTTDQSAANAIVDNNFGASSCYFVNSNLGTSGLNAMIVPGVIKMQNVTINCVTNFIDSCSFQIDDCVFTDELVTVTNATGFISSCRFDTGIAASVSMNSAMPMSLTNCTINSSGTPAIINTGLGALNIANCSFLDEFEISGGGVTNFVTTNELKVPVTLVPSGASPQTCDARFGSVVFPANIGSVASQTFRIENIYITSDTQTIMFSFRGYAGSPPVTIAEWTVNGAGSFVDIIVWNYFGSAFIGDATFIFWLMD